MFKFSDFPAKRLYTISKAIVDKAFFMGGYKVNYYSANVCNYTFPNGKNCFDERTLSPTINCPVCKGTGVVYSQPIETLAIVIDNPNAPERKREGVILTDEFRLILPPEIPVKILKVENSGRIFVARDKFDIFSSNGTFWTTFYVNSEPKDVWLAGMLYKSVRVATHYLSVREATGNKDYSLENTQYTEVVQQTRQVLGIQTKKEDIEDILNNIFIDLQKNNE